MAQSKSFFTHRHGSTKSHTYATNAGQQITKDRVDETTNQRTESQMVHRCLIHTMSDAHAWLRPFFGNLWNGAPAGRKQLAAFREANYAILRNAALGGLAGFTYSPYQETTIPMGYFKVTNGKLPYNGHLFQNGVNGVYGVTTGLFNVTQSGAEWYEVLSSIGLRPLDTLALVILIYSPGTYKMTLDLFEVKVLDHPNVVIGQQGSDDLVTVTPKVLANAWTVTKDSGRLITLTLPKLTRDISDSVLLTCCFQVRKDGSRILCSDGYLWHWADNVSGLTFPQALDTYPQNVELLKKPSEVEPSLPRFKFVWNSYRALFFLTDNEGNVLYRRDGKLNVKVSCATTNARDWVADSNRNPVATVEINWTTEEEGPIEIDTFALEGYETWVSRYNGDTDDCVLNYDPVFEIP